MLVTPWQVAFGVGHRSHADLAFNADVTGVVTDSTNGRPLASAEVSVANQAGAVIANATASTFGAFTFHNLAPGSYLVRVRLIGFRAEEKPLTIGPSASAAQIVNFALTPIGKTLQAMQVTTQPVVTLDSRTGNQIFKQNAFHSAPTTTTSQIIQASVAGAARGPTGEVHIRGQHAEYTYYVDGVPVPPGISGSLNELFDPDVVDHIDFQTGGWDAEYGGRIAAVVNVTTKIPSGGFQGNASAYGGGFSGSTVSGPTGSNGQSALVSDNRGPWGFFVSGARQFSDMRLEPLVIDPVTHLISNFHHSGTDLYGFGKLQYTPGTHDVLMLEVNLSTTEFAVPFDSTGGAFQNDHQNDANSFVNFGWHHQIGDPDSAGQTRGDVFGALFFRHSSLRYDPDPNDDPAFQFFPDTLQHRREPKCQHLWREIRLHAPSRSRDGIQVRNAVVGDDRPRGFLDLQCHRARAPVERNAEWQRHRLLRTNRVLARRTVPDTSGPPIRFAISSKYADAKPAEPAPQAQLLSVGVDDRLLVLRSSLHADEHRGPSHDYERRAGRRGESTNAS
jgi:hypothetical protein